MGLLELLGSTLGDDAQSSGTPLLQGILDLLDEPQSGGIAGLAQLFQKQGMGELAASWIGTGANRSISPDELERALGSERVDALGRRAGLSHAATSSALASLLPEIVNQLTPQGEVPQRSAMLGLGKQLLAGLAIGGVAAAGVAAVRRASAASGPAAAPASGRPAPDFSDVQADASTAPVEESYTVVAGDSLSKIAKRLYGDANEWRRIFEANRDQIKNPDLIHPGQKLRIPRG
jgi:uncharacterized protein YidB (DUF937 family)